MLGLLGRGSHGGHQPDKDQGIGFLVRVRITRLSHKRREQWLQQWIHEHGLCLRPTKSRPHHAFRLFPYQATQETCQTKKLQNHSATISGYKNVTANEQNLSQAAASQPLSVAIDAVGFAFQF